MTQSSRHCKDLWGPTFWCWAASKVTMPLESLLQDKIESLRVYGYLQLVKVSGWLNHLNFFHTSGHFPKSVLLPLRSIGAPLKAERCPTRSSMTSLIEDITH